MRYACPAYPMPYLNSMVKRPRLAEENEFHAFRPGKTIEENTADHPSPMWLAVCARHLAILMAIFLGERPHQHSLGLIISRYPGTGCTVQERQFQWP